MARKTLEVNACMYRKREPWILTGGQFRGFFGRSFSTKWSGIEIHVNVTFSMVVCWEHSWECRDLNVWPQIVRLDVHSAIAFVDVHVCSYGFLVVKSSNLVVAVWSRKTLVESKVSNAFYCPYTFNNFTHRSNNIFVTMRELWRVISQVYEACILSSKNRAF